jgi:hypothetical protein
MFPVAAKPNENGTLIPSPELREGEKDFFIHSSSGRSLSAKLE